MVMLLQALVAVGNVFVIPGFVGDSVKQISRRYRAVIQVVTENGPEIEGVFKELRTQYHIPHTRISP